MRRPQSPPDRGHPSSNLEPYLAMQLDRKTPVGDCEVGDDTRRPDRHAAAATPVGSHRSAHANSRTSDFRARVDAILCGAGTVRDRRSRP